MPDEFSPYDIQDPKPGKMRDLSGSPAKSRPGKVIKPPADAASINGVAKDQLLSLIQRIERVNEEIAAVQDDRKEIFAEAKASGFDVKTIRRVLQLRKLEASERAEQDAMLDLYLSALGMIAEVA